VAGQGKQAKVLTDTQVRAALAACDRHRYPLRDRVMILLSVRAGLRAKEIACLRWRMVTDAEGQVGDALHLENRSSKGRNGGRTIPLHRELREALVALRAARNVDGDDRVIHSERDLGMSAGAVQVWFHRHYQALGFAGASSHSGRRTFVTKLARKIVEAGGSLRDVQELAGHASLTTTQRYIQGNSDAKRRAIDLI
jgi:integrase/recombinase XerD